jgi:UPF0271 protein
MYPEIGRMDVNADLGEGVTDDAGLLGVVTSANVACGFHAGDEAVMREVCERAVERGVVIGAQVSYADREGFGRRPMDPGSDRLAGWVREQVELLGSIAAAAGTEVQYVKAHGALYNRAADDAEQARAVLAGSGVLPVLGLPGSTLLRLATLDGRRAVAEGFPDRGYTAEGRLVPRSEPGALVEDPERVAANALRLARSGELSTVCVHGDSAGAVATAVAVRAALEAAGIRVVPWAAEL